MGFIVSIVTGTLHVVQAGAQKNMNRLNLRRTEEDVTRGLHQPLSLAPPARRPAGLLFGRWSSRTECSSGRLHLQEQQRRPC